MATSRLPIIPQCMGSTFYLLFLAFVLVLPANFARGDIAVNLDVEVRLDHIHCGLYCDM